MKHTIIKVLAALIVVSMMLCVCSCGKKDENPFTGADGGGANTPQGSSGDIVEEKTGNGFEHNHAVAAGFGMGTDTLADISSRLGAPMASTTDEYTALTIITAEYPFGQIEFESTDGSEPVLTFAQITSDVAGPCGVTIGMDMAQVAELIYKGSGSMISSTDEQTIYFYGGDGNIPYGMYVFLTIEFTSSQTEDCYALEYCARSYDESKVTKYSLYFNEEGKLIRYTLRYS